MYSVSEPIGGTRGEPRERTTVFEHPGDDPIEVVVTEAVSTVADVDPVQFETRLYDAVDPDSLRRVIRSGGADVEVSFRFGDYRVTLLGDERIAITESSETVDR